MVETIAIGLAQFFSEHVCAVCGRHTVEITSLSAGVAVSYLFLGLFPEFVREVQHTDRWLYVFALLGFVLFHLVEKYIYQHSAPQAVTTRLERENSAVSFAYHFIVGIVIVDLTAMGFANGCFLSSLWHFTPLSAPSLNTSLRNGQCIWRCR